MKYVGVKQVKKAIENGEVSTVYVGDDAEPHVIAPLLKLCEENKIEIKHIATMEALGEMANVEVKSAAAAE